MEPYNQEDEIEDKPKITSHKENNKGDNHKN
jgi:hypothetical protein